MTAASNLVGRRATCRTCGALFTIPGQMPAEPDRPVEQESEGPAVHSPVLMVAAAAGALLFLVWASIYPALFLLVLLPLGWALWLVRKKLPEGDRIMVDKGVGVAALLGLFVLMIVAVERQAGPTRAVLPAQRLTEYEENVRVARHYLKVENPRLTEEELNWGARRLADTWEEAKRNP